MKSQLIKSVEISLKWEAYRDSVKKFFLIDKEKGEKEYNERMSAIQTLIKKVSIAMGIGHIQSVMLLAEGQDDGMGKLQVLAAGFELINGNDLTSKS